MTKEKKHRGIHVSGYYTRARVFVWLMLLVGATYLAFYLYQRFRA